MVRRRRIAFRTGRRRITPVPDLDEMTTRIAQVTNMSNYAASLIACLATAFAASGCDSAGPVAGNGVAQTGFPGQVSAGGGTSGQVMAKAGDATKASSPAGTPGIPQGSGGNTGGATMGGTTQGANAGQETLRGQSPVGGVGGTPSIPEGSGGTASGAAMGGTTEGAAATQVAPPPGGATPSVPAQGGK